MELVTPLLLSAFPALMIIGALRDVTTMTIPNKISLALLALFFPTALAVGLEWSVAAMHVGVGFGALLVGMLIFALRWVGGGDAKLLAAACLWLGAPAIPHFLLWTAVAGGAFSILLIQARTFGQPYAVRAPRWVGRLLEPKGDIPYGVAICIGALAAFPRSPLMESFSGVF